MTWFECEYHENTGKTWNLFTFWPSRGVADADSGALMVGKIGMSGHPRIPDNKPVFVVVSSLEVLELVRARRHQPPSVAAKGSGQT